MVRAENERAEQTRMGVFVIEGQPVFTRVCAHAIPYTIIDFRHQVAFLDIQHFVKAIWDMESESGFSL